MVFAAIPPTLIQFFAGFVSLGFRTYMVGLISVKPLTHADEHGRLPPPPVGCLLWASWRLWEALFCLSMRTFRAASTIG
jgi:hypothetical protein